MLIRLMFCAALAASVVSCNDAAPAGATDDADDASGRRPLGPDTGRPDVPRADDVAGADTEAPEPDVDAPDATPDVPEADASTDPPAGDVAIEVGPPDAGVDVPLADVVDEPDAVPDVAPDVPLADVTDEPDVPLVDAAPDTPVETPLDPSVSVPPADNEPCDTPGAMFECSGIAICRLYSAESSRCESCEPCGNLYAPCSSSSECDILFTCFEGYCSAMCSFETPQTCGVPTNCIDVGHPTHGVCRRSF